MNQPIGPAQIIKKKATYQIPCSYHFYEKPPQLVRGEMQYLYDSEATRYLDFFAGVSVMNCGHTNPEILDKTIAQMRMLQHTTSIYLTEPVVNLAEKLAQVMPKALKRTFFCSTGSEANEGAMLLAKLHTNNHEFIALDLGLHGRTQLTMSATGIGMWRTTATPSGGIHFAPNPYCYRCPFSKTRETCEFACVKAVETVITRNTSGKVAAMIAEPIQGNGGIIVPPNGYFKALKKVLEKYQIPLIIDEIQTGFARTGKMFAIEHFGVTPEIITMAKALGNGVPIAAYATTDQLASSFTKPSASTLGGNPVSATAGIAVLDYIKDHNLIKRAQLLGDKLKAELQRLQLKYPLIGDVRGLGLMIGIELVHAQKRPAPAETDLILEKLKDRGILVGKNGEHRNVIALQPPLVITEADIDFFLNNFDAVLKELSTP